MPQVTLEGSKAHQHFIELFKNKESLETFKCDVSMVSPLFDEDLNPKKLISLKEFIVSDIVSFDMFTKIEKFGQFVIDLPALKKLRLVAKGEMRDVNYSFQYITDLIESKKDQL
eukprot:CAMPEP_0114579276 /NCGR_PEP_ID=MMETSP0125-20121206/3685_1 /TAXON_ID=485358 ORGANISM="Aristerostoma sp., Strain ATCC 50986" /NCGR_SAMPLE_ID=MMETSP0125 /ASSEMBLY_ACC=CAM_ASM_000245 /LENGTH=113 /DNA_ID=CAMNT_0001769923 /DNA_START=1190 /DNA_END=1531 /DNA_ORIENTATION=-